MKLEEVRLPHDQEQEVSYTIFCDMDGVLANLKATAARILNLGPDFSEEKYFTDKNHRDIFWKAVKEYQDKHGYTFWRDLDPMPDAMQLWNYIKRHNAQILSATGQDRYKAAEQKRAWVTDHLGSHVRMNFVVSAPLKAQYAAPLHVLIDDQHRAIDPFKAAGGIGILHTSAASTIEQLKKLGI